MFASKTLFWDLDVGADAGKYPTQQDALAALQQQTEMQRAQMNEARRATAIQLAIQAHSGAERGRIVDTARDFLAFITEA